MRSPAQMKLSIDSADTATTIPIINNIPAGIQAHFILPSGVGVIATNTKVNPKPKKNKPIFPVSLKISSKPTKIVRVNITPAGMIAHQLVRSAR